MACHVNKRQHNVFLSIFRRREVPQTPSTNEWQTRLPERRDGNLELSRSMQRWL